jgi:hypothetical protein
MKAVNLTHEPNYLKPARSFALADHSMGQSRKNPEHLVFPKDPSMPRQSAELLQQRHRQIAELAYYRAQQRGFEPGHELEDWLAAEAEVDNASRPLEIY